MLVSIDQYSLPVGDWRLAIIEAPDIAWTRNKDHSHFQIAKCIQGVSELGYAIKRAVLRGHEFWGHFVRIVLASLREILHDCDATPSGSAKSFYLIS